MDLARKELGEEALLVNARPSTPETRSLGTYEVVFGVPAQAIAGPQASLPPPLPPADAVAKLSAEVADLRRMMAEWRELARDLLVPERQPKAEEKRPRQTTDATLGRVTMLVGPPGAGKTTALIKLAARYGVHAGKQTQILTTDVFRVAASEQLQTLAAILGAGCAVVEPARQLSRAIAEHPEKQFLLIDTPGFALTEMGEGLELARAAAAYGELDTHLVLPASMKPADLARIADAYSIFQPAKLLITRVDETLDCSPVVEQAARLGLPISFLSTGQRVPDDIEPATRRRIAELLGQSPIQTAAPPAGSRSRGASA